MRFPVTVKHRGVKAKIYGKSPAYPFYRVAYRVAGKRVVRSFTTYSAAVREAESKVKEVHEGNQSAALTPREAADSLTVREVLDALRRDTGKRVSPVAAASEYAQAIRLLGDRPIIEAVRGFLATVATVKRKVRGVGVGGVGTAWVNGFGHNELGYRAPRRVHEQIRAAPLPEIAHREPPRRSIQHKRLTG